MRSDRSLITAPGVAGRTLPAALTINGITRTPAFRYRGRDATTTTWPAWGYGGDLSIFSAGADPTVGLGSPCLGELDGSVQFGGGKLWKGSVPTIGTRDIVFEALAAHSNPGTFGVLVGHDNGGQGCSFFCSVGNQFTFYIDTATGTASVTSAAITNYAWYHILVFCDRSGSGQMYLDGVASGSAVSLAAVTDSADGGETTLGGGPLAGGKSTDHQLAYCALWAESDWLDTHLQAAVAKERFTQALGCLAAHNHGAVVPSTL